MTKLGLTLFILISLSAFGGDAQVGEECEQISNPEVDVISQPVLSSCFAEHDVASFYDSFFQERRTNLHNDLKKFCACAREGRSVSDLVIARRSDPLPTEGQCKDLEKSNKSALIDMSFHVASFSMERVQSETPDKTKEAYANINSYCPRYLESFRDFKDHPLIKNDDGGPQQCMSSREFLAFSKVPQFNPFYKFLASPSGQLPKNWKIDEVRKQLANQTRSLANAISFSRGDFLHPNFPQNLQKRLDDYNSNNRDHEIEAPDWEEVGTLVERIYFLNSNPFIRDFLQDSDIPAGDKQRLIRKFSGSLVPDLNCIRRDPNSCKDRAMAEINFSDFNKSILDFYGEGAFSKSIDVQNRQAIAQVQSLKDYYSGNSDQKSREEIFIAQELNLESRACLSSPQSQECLSQFQTACNVIQTNPEPVAENEIVIRAETGPSRFSSQVEEASLQVFNTPENSDFSQFIQDLCSNPEPNRNGIRLTFEEYFNTRCSSSSTNCPSRQKLLVDYLKEFKPQNKDLIAFLSKTTVEDGSRAFQSVSRFGALRDALGNFNTQTSSTSREKSSVPLTNSGSRSEPPATQTDANYFNPSPQTTSAANFISSAPPASAASSITFPDDARDEEIRSLREDRERFDAELARIREEYAQMQSREPRDSAAEERIKQLEEQIAAMAKESRARDEYLRKLASQGESSRNSNPGRSIASTNEGQSSASPRSSNGVEPIAPQFAQRRVLSSDPSVSTQPVGGQSAAFSPRAILGGSGSSEPRSLTAPEELNRALIDLRSTPTLVVSLGPTINLSQEYYNLAREGKFSQLPSSVQNEILALVESGQPPIVAHDSKELVAARVAGEIRFFTRAEYDQQFGNRQPASVPEPVLAPDCQDAARLGSLNSLLGVSAGVDSACPN